MRCALPNQFTGFLPPVEASLESLRDVDLKHGQRDLSHPIDIYRISSRAFWENLEDLLDVLDWIRLEKPYLTENESSRWARKLVKQLDHTLDSLVEHVDACESIVASCFPFSEKKKCGKAVRAFRKAAEKYIKRIKIIVNSVKHRSTPIHVIYFYGRDEFVPGFYLEGGLDEGVAGPDPRVHKDSNTAISLYRDLRIYVCSVYFASSFLANELKKAVRAEPSPSFEIPANTERHVMNVLKRVADLPRKFFPDEVREPVPEIRWIGGARGPGAIIEWPAQRPRARPPSPEARINAQWTVGSVARTLKLPYFGEGYKRTT